MESDPAARALQSCLARGVHEFVVCAGARNAPLVRALAGTEGVTVWSHFEERGAGFFFHSMTWLPAFRLASVYTSALLN